MSVLIQEQNTHFTRPFVHRLRTASKCYVFDVNTNGILRVDSLTYELLEDAPLLSAEDLCDKYAHLAIKSDILACRENLLESMAKGPYFQTERPKEIAYPLSRDDVSKALDKGLQQLSLEITTACNMRCSYCTYSDAYPNTRSHGNRSMSLDIAKQAIDFFMPRALRPEELVADKRKLGFTFYGGEPLLNLHLIDDALDYIETSYPEYKGHTVASMTTNGTLLNEAAFEVLAKHSVGLLISLDGPEVMHDRLARFANGGPTWRTVVENIQKLESYEELHGVEIRHRLIAVYAADSDLRELVRFATDTAPVLFKRAKYARISNINPAHENTLNVDWLRGTKSNAEAYEQLREQFIREVRDGTYLESESTLEEIHVLELLFAESFRGLYQRKGQGCVATHWPDKLYPGSSCLFGQRKLHVTIDGKFLPCERCEDQFDYFDCGSLNRGFDIDKIHKNLCEYTACNAEMCKDCWIIRFCGTHCPATLCTHDRLDNKRKVEQCERARSHFSSCLQVMLEVMERNPDAWKFLEKYHVQ